MEVDLDIIPTVNKSLIGRDLNADEFTFAVFENGDSSFTNTSEAIMIGKNVAAKDGEKAHIYFEATDYGVEKGLADDENDTLIFSEIGKYEYDIVEIEGTLGGVKYSKTIYDLIVEVTDQNGTLSARHYFVDSAGESVTFTNTYSAEPTGAVIEGIKKIEVNSGVKELTAGMFKFGLYDEAGEKIDEAYNLANGHFSFDKIEYNLADVGKTFKYTVKEIAPDGTTDGSYKEGGITYSAQSFEVSVSVKDNGDGTLSADVTGNGIDNIEFVNVYESKTASVTLRGDKALEGRDLTAGEYDFVLYSSNSSFTEEIAIVKQNGEDFVTHDAEGNFVFVISGLDMGEYHYILREVIPKERAAGIKYDASEYYVTVSVSDDGHGQMQANKTVYHTGQPNVSNPDITFENIYAPEAGVLSISGNKTYNGGKALEDEVFFAELYDEYGNLLDRAPIMADGTFAFGNIEFNAENVGDTYVYEVKEFIPDGATDNADGTFTFENDIYDGTVYVITVNINDDDKDGKLEIVSVITADGEEVSEISFINTYVPEKIPYTPLAQKKYNKELLGGEFKFKLTGEIDGMPVLQEKTNGAGGAITFDTLNFPKEGTYSFTVTEIDKILGFIEYSTATYELVVEVINTNGELSINSVTVNTVVDGTIEFVNTYLLEGEDEVIIRGTKELTGGRTKPNANEFTFGLYDSDGELVESVLNDADGNFEFTALKFDEKDVPIDGSKQVMYTVKEIKGDDIRITYDETEYTVVVTVEDNDEGGIKASYTVEDHAEDGIVFTNVYTPKPDDITVVFDILKNVENKGTAEIGSDGFEFVLNALADGVADEADVSDEDGKASFTLTFTEEDIGNTYTYEITETKGNEEYLTYDETKHTVTVAIELDADNKLVAKLTVNGDEADEVKVEFNNTYDFTPKADDPMGDESSFLLWSALLIVFAGAIVTLALIDKKKRINSEE